MKYFDFFNVKELFASCTPDEIVACCSSHCIDSLLVLLQVLDGFRDFVNRPIRINSSYRSPIHNKNVGGVENSQHLLGQAIDFSAVDIDFNTFAYQFRDFCDKSALSQYLGQCIIYYNKRFIHIGLRTLSHKNLCIYEKRNNQNNH